MAEKIPTSRYGLLVARIERLIAAFGPMTRQELRQLMPDDAKNVSSVVSRMSKKSPRQEKRLYVASYTLDEEGKRRYPRAIFAVGSKPDAPKPLSLASIRAMRHREAKKVRVSSVWELGKPVKQRGVSVEGLR